jgi:TolB-like protein
MTSAMKLDPEVPSRKIVSANGIDARRPPLSLIVLPFLNLSPDVELGYFVDGVVDGLMTEVYRALPDSFIVSRSTAFTFRGREVPVRQIGSELQVRHVLEGSMLADASRVRVNAQLIDAVTDEHIWVERFDKERKDVLRAHEEIVARLARGVRIEMLRSASALDHGNGTESDDPTHLVIRGRALVNDVRQTENVLLAVTLFRRALDLEPLRVEAMIGLASARVFQLLFRYDCGDRDTLLDEAENLISNAFTLAPDSFGVLKARPMLLRAHGKFAEAAIAAHAVLAQSPGEPTTLREIGLNKLYLGKPLEAAEWLRRADRGAPADAMRWTWLQGLAIALMQLGQDAEAITVSRQMVQNHPGWARGEALLAAAEALAGDIESAARHMAQFMAVNPGKTAAEFADERAAVPSAAVSPGYRRGLERILDGLCRAGMPAGSSRSAAGCARPRIAGDAA